MVSENELLTQTCRYIKIMTDVSGAETLESDIAERVLKGELTDEQLEFVMDVFKSRGRMNHIEKLITPVSDKKFTTSWNHPTEYFPTETPLDDVKIKDGNTHWIYIHSEVQGRYGETYWISTDCSSSLSALPVIKAFKEYTFEIGKFYTVKCVDEIRWGNNKKKYIFEINECSEDEYMRNGFISDALDSGHYDKWYMEDIIATYHSNNRRN